MSDFQRGPGWWLASDGKWYPPAGVPQQVAPQPKGGRGCLVALAIAAGLVLVLVVVGALASDPDPDDDDSGPSLLAPRCASGLIDSDEFAQIRTGMRYPEVVQIIGGQGEVLSSASVAGFTTRIHSWQGEGGLGANANVTFQNGAVAGKAQFGLGPSDC